MLTWGLLAVRGTSPRMRGKLILHGNERACQRNIPAYAGKTSNSIFPLGPIPEHPRVCGENRGCGGRAVGKLGTSPRMRGKLAEGLRVSYEMRNIPAYAGKTCFL